MKKPTNRYAIIVAGGSGTRIGSALPKQFLNVQNKPIIVHTLEKFIAASPEIQCIIALPEAYFSLWENISQQYNLQHIPYCKGGKSRFESVKNALNTLNDSSENTLVAVHDSVRPFVTPQLIAQCFEAAEKWNAIIPVISPNDSLRQIENEKSWSVNRNNFRIVQTPQCFKLHLLKKAYLQAESPLFTDDASVVEAAGHTIHLIEGLRENIKITQTFDLLLAAFIANTH
ncbi:MAG: 2-C-methyl-D-erythritol 4-phosphate cytidylyltransferase [Chitinophagales bacterium]|nr:2-C-methyl-D-erythritol 4-phosphate cytidylyltransferase [Bacteroidota bacterium]MCB9042281.1 2-C-methyl-D-erythritol 4-phosphate cytidylyltransferase [Chitinophagales bacterium]